jgi:hypothetical protein
MDMVAETQTPTVEWARVAQTIMEQLSADEQAEVRSAVDRLARGVDPPGLVQVHRSRPGLPPFLRVAANARIAGLF